MLLPLSLLAGIYHWRTFSRTNTTFWDKRFAAEVIWYGPKWKRLFVTIGVLMVLDRLVVYWPF